MLKPMLLQLKPYAFATQNLCFCNSKPMLLQLKTYAFATQNLCFWILKADI